MSEGWAARKIKRLVNDIEDRKRNEALELQRHAKIQSAAPTLFEQLVKDIEAAVDAFNELRAHEKFGHDEIPTLTFKRTNPPWGIEVDAATSALNLSYNDRSLLVEYQITREAASPRKAPTKDTGSLTYILDEDQVWLQREDDKKLSVPEAADLLLDMLI